MKGRIVPGMLAAIVLAGIACMSRAAVQSEAGPQRRSRGTPVKASRAFDDPMIPSPEELGPDTPARAFVESFLVALAGRQQGEVYDLYLDKRFQVQVSRESFVRHMDELTKVLGQLDRLAVVYFRQDNEDGPLPDRGRADYVLVFERDPRVDAHVEFERGGDRLWRVTNYSLNSPLLERLYRARSAAGAGEQDEDAGTRSEAPRPPSP